LNGRSRHGRADVHHRAADGDLGARQEIYDVMGKDRVFHDRLKNIA